MNRDLLHSLSPQTVGQASLKQLKETDTSPKEIQAVAFAITLLSYCRKKRIEVGDVFTVANNILYSKEAEQAPALRALHNYMQFEF